MNSNQYGFKTQYSKYSGKEDNNMEAHKKRQMEVINEMSDKTVGDMIKEETDDKTNFFKNW